MAFYTPPLIIDGRMQCNKCLWLISLLYTNKLWFGIEMYKLAQVGSRHFTKLAHSQGSKWWRWRRGASVSQPSSLGRREKEAGERRYIQSLISLCFSCSLSNSYLHARQWSNKEGIKPTLSGLSFTRFQFCRVTRELSSSPDIIPFSSLLFFIHHCRRLRQKRRQTFASLKGSRWHLMASDEKALSLSDCPVVLISDLLINCCRDQSERKEKRNQKPVTNPHIYNGLQNVGTYFTKLWISVLLSGVFHETVSSACLSATGGVRPTLNLKKMYCTRGWHYLNKPNRAMHMHTHARAIVNTHTLLPPHKGCRVVLP